MRIACPCNGEEMVMKFCHAKYFKIYDVEGKDITAKSEILNNSEGHEEVALMLKDIGVDTVVCAMIGDHGVSTLNKVGINVFAGVRGDLDSIVKAFANNEIQLVFNTPIHLHDEGCGCHHDHDEECGCHHHDDECCEEEHHCHCHHDEN